LSWRPRAGADPALTVAIDEDESMGPKPSMSDLLVCWLAVAALVALSLAALWFGVLAT
jgi:hypothetical protein